MYREIRVRPVVHYIVTEFHQEENSVGCEGISAEFNQDVTFADDGNQDSDGDRFTPGMRVQHPSFGAGTIVTRRGDVVTVHFDMGKQKTLALSIAPLQAL